MNISTKEVLINAAERHLAQYPQYRGHFKDYQLVRVNRRIRTKMGVAFEKGDISVGKRSRDDRELGYTVWSFRNMIDTGLELRDVTRL